MVGRLSKIAPGRSEIGKAPVSAPLEFFDVSWEMGYGEFKGVATNHTLVSLPRERHSPEWRLSIRQSGDWRSQISYFRAVKGINGFGTGATSASMV